MDDPEVLRLFRRLELLKRLDYELDIHGAWTFGCGHRYKYEGMSEAEITCLESDLGFELPEQCRRWMSSVGKGVGPGYGLICSTVDDYVVSEDPVPSRTVRDVNELTAELLLQFTAAMEESGDLKLFDVRSYAGLMTLCQHGCGWDSYLILAGPMKGYVVDDTAAAGIPGGLCPGYGARPENILPTFFEWVDWWIECSIESVESIRLARKERQKRRS